MASSTSTYGSGLNNEPKLTTHITFLTLMASGFFQQETIFTQNDNKTRGTSSHLRFIIQAHKSFWGNFGSCGSEG